MQLSLLICSRNRANRLHATLSKLNQDSMRRYQVELVLVDSASEDETFSTMRSFRESARIKTLIVRAERKGIGHASNLGIRNASNKDGLLIFSDDDCYLDQNYFDQIVAEFDPVRFQYGGGAILQFDPLDDPRVARLPLETKTVIKKQQLLPAGAIQGANMFFLRRVFDVAGYFNEDMESAVDIEMATRSSFAGFTGVLLPSVRVYHDHGRRRGSAEANATVARYDAGRGAYYASLLASGISETWRLWMQMSRCHGPMPHELLVRLEREFGGAAEFLRHMIAKRLSKDGQL